MCDYTLDRSGNFFPLSMCLRTAYLTEIKNFFFKSTIDKIKKYLKYYSEIHK